MLKTFRIGGIHPPENKLSAGKKIEQLALPDQVVIPLSQHLGAPTQAVVAKGDKVKVGTLIAKAGGFVSANVHASVSGTVAKIDTVVDASGYRKPALFIDVEGDEWEPSIDLSEELSAHIDSISAEDILRKISENGIVGMGGATFPTHVKLTPPSGMKAEILIVNGVECEPYLTADHALMLEKGKEILIGVRLLMKSIQVNKAIIAIENNKKDAIANLELLAREYEGIEVCPLQMKYPQGGEKQLIDAVISRQVPSGALPIATGAVVQNVATAFAVYEAVMKNKPLIERVVTVTGKCLTHPSNFKVRIGTSISLLIEAAGGLPEDTGKVIGGGPMMGKALVSTSVPITKGSSGVLLISRKESQRKESTSCIRCAKCTSVCSMGLEPFLLGTLAERGMFEEMEKELVMNCIECGSCNFTCPAHRPLLDYIRLGKSKVGAIIRNRKK
ncbi:MAG: electron transport complex subunit RsxC [Bacteroidales bacterium]|jgi:Na+-translocating ferredoxin:NAD+ oxidoreductase subunit C|nr:electron transport complex subunit RsxC [Bacteroidales bacterium]